MQYRKLDRNYKFKKFYLYLLGLGLMLFGVFVMLFRTFDHPIYGHLDFGAYHLFLGVVFILLSAAVLLFIRRRY